MWEQARYVRALPGYLLAVGDRVETAVGVQRVMRIEWEEVEEKQSLVMTKPGS